MGGANSVRAYRSGVLSGDSGAFGSLELLELGHNFLADLPDEMQGNLHTNWLEADGFVLPAFCFFLFLLAFFFCLFVFFVLFFLCFLTPWVLFFI